MIVDFVLYILFYKVDDQDIVVELNFCFGVEIFIVQFIYIGMLVFWVLCERLIEVLIFFCQVFKFYVMFYDLYGVDEWLCIYCCGLLSVDFSVFYYLMLLECNSDVMIKVVLFECDFNLFIVICIWFNVNWYECEVWDMYGIIFIGYLYLICMLMLLIWQGYLLCKDYLVCVIEFDFYFLFVVKQDLEQEVLCFKLEDWGMKCYGENEDYMFFNFGLNYLFVYGVFCIILQLDGEEIIDCVLEIGYYYCGVEKMVECQFWYSFIFYIDCIDYFGGVMNNLFYVFLVEKFVGIKVLQWVDVIWIMMVEFFCILNYLLYLGIYIQDVGVMILVFFIFIDCQCVYKVVEVIIGFCLYLVWYCIGGVVYDLLCGWDKLVCEFFDWMFKCFDEYEIVVLKNSILCGWIIGVVQYNIKEVFEWGIIGVGLCVIGCDFDLCKVCFYFGYENFEFEVLLVYNGDVYDCCMVKMGEMCQSLWIIEQCLKNMLEGFYKVDYLLIMLLLKECML